MKKRWIAILWVYGVVVFFLLCGLSYGMLGAWLNSDSGRETRFLQWVQTESDYAEDSLLGKSRQDILGMTEDPSRGRVRVGTKSEDESRLGLSLYLDDSKCCLIEISFDETGVADSVSYEYSTDGYHPPMP